MKWLVAVLFLLELTGCVMARPKRGNVAMKISEKEAHICLGSKDLKPGDKIEFLFNDCTQNGEKTPRVAGLCELVPLGRGVVIKTINSHYSAVKTDGSFSFSEGTLVQKAD